MIEFCTKKRMLLACGFLISVSVIVLIIENSYSFHSKMKEIATPENGSYEPCWEADQVNVLEECAPCNNLEYKVHDFCQRTGYKEKVQCMDKDKVQNEVYRSCPKVGWLEERTFWTFETVTFLVGILSYGIVYVRQKRLDQLLMDKVHKQIAAGV